MKNLYKSVFLGLTVMVTLFLVTVVLAESAPKVEMPDHLKLKVSKDRVLGSVESDSVVKYAYRSDIRIDTSPSSEVVKQARNKGVEIKEEILEQRTKHSRTFSTTKEGEYVTEIIANVPQYYKDVNGVWWQAEYATTTKNAFDAQVASTFGERIAELFLPHTQADTSTFFPDFNPESASVDGVIYNTQGPGSSWDITRNATDGNNVNTSPDVNISVPFVKEFNDATDKYQIGRGYYLFDTSSIPDTHTILSATLSIFVNAVRNQDSDGKDYITTVNTNPASNTTLIATDYDQIKNTDGNFPLGGTGKVMPKQSNDIFINNVNAGAYNNWTLNATGLANINVSGVTKLGQAEGHDVEDFSIATDTENWIDIATAETPDTVKDPKLVVVHSAIIVTSAYKPATESRTNNPILTRDTDLVLSLASDTTYSVEGAIFAAASSTVPDLRIAFSIPSGTMDIAYIAAQGVNSNAELLETSGATSTNIGLTANPKVIHVKGTIKTGATSGTVEFRWAQNVSNTNRTSILKGSYLKAEVLQ